MLPWVAPSALRTPISRVRSVTETSMTLLDPQVTVSPSERTRYVHGVLDEARRLDRLIRDLFELARLEAGATGRASSSRQRGSASNSSAVGTSSRSRRTTSPAARAALV